MQEQQDAARHGSTHPQPCRWLVFPVVMAPRGLFCPEHAPTWLRYLASVEAWGAARREAKKRHWLERFTRWVAREGDPEAPASPFARGLDHGTEG